MTQFCSFLSVLLSPDFQLPKGHPPLGFSFGKLSFSLSALLHLEQLTLSPSASTHCRRPLLHTSQNSQVPFDTPPSRPVNPIYGEL